MWNSTLEIPKLFLNLGSKFWTSHRKDRNNIAWSIKFLVLIKIFKGIHLSGAIYAQQNVDTITKGPRPMTLFVLDEERKLKFVGEVWLKSLLMDPKYAEKPVYAIWSNKSVFLYF